MGHGLHHDLKVRSSLAEIPLVCPLDGDRKNLLHVFEAVKLPSTIHFHWFVFVSFQRKMKIC